MRKVALVFVLAVFVPSLVLAWLAVRSLSDQQFVLERQQSLLCQGVTDSLAKQISDYLADRQREFNAKVDSMITDPVDASIAVGFDEKIRKAWPLAVVGFCVTTSGNLLAPLPSSRPEARAFCEDNGAFLCNRESIEIYLNPAAVKGGNNYNDGFGGNQKQVAESVTAQSFSPAPSAANGMQRDNTSSANGAPVSNYKMQSRKVIPAQQGGVPPVANEPAKDEQALSRLVPAEAEFAQLVGDSRDGMVARFVQNKLKLMFWHRPERDPRLIFGAQLDIKRIVEDLQALVRNSALPERGNSLSLRGSELPEGDICVALLDDTAKPAALSHASFTANWKRPFVATEIGEALPHWEAAAYLLDPAKLTQSARSIRFTLGLLIAVLVLAIGVGSWLIVTDLNRQLMLARQKTDFVSNVSHELKTPLTSIRMFSELLAEGRVEDAAKQRSYLSIITAEAARLTRLINNVLDFSRLERGEKKYNFVECDLAKVARETAESYRPHLENSGYKFDCTAPESQLRVRGDCDALAQIIVNLLSNAEKYSSSRKEIEVHAARRDGPLPCAEVMVLDRGPGVSRGSEEKIFEKFYRTHDSLSSGIQGSGLGLTLARQIARAHGGDVVYEARADGGSCFCLRLPLIYETPEVRD